MKNLVLMMIVAVFAVAGLQAGVHEIDTEKSTVSFMLVKNGETKIPGTFKGITGKFDLDDGKLSMLKAELNVDTVDSANEKRDKKIMNADWFNKAKYPTVSFELDSVDSTGKFKGKITMIGVTKEVHGMVKMEGEKMTFTGSINKDDYGMKGGNSKVSDIQLTVVIVPKAHSHAKHDHKH